ncbi:Bug family tripartite tricarboxylate transporter substrate binding protein [Caldovatus aquaticus]|uniref:Tripartite tricarboxylate transporter substrate binding protein n=1 Tax=Caldovatus aquaticus TaxID=2865671 RepID=A0ABS7F8A3_9PROT|nr:tripartite tricarboxylate transporter substrate binding protein [Caldovatus aquaticus]MBW8271192.1 tripartite tricarboxylate transporter substrate binding protein [Caldovatus aquaticus]
MDIRRRTVLRLGVAAGAAAAPAGGGHAQQAEGFPERAVRYIVPFPPGGLTDIMARIVGQRLSEIWGRPVVVDNRPGGNALLGPDIAAKAPPDGHTLLAITMTHAVNASLFPNAPFDLLRDFAPVSVLGLLPLVVTVNANSPWRTLEELTRAVRTERLSGGSSPNGSPPHLGLELLRRHAGARENLVHVPYRGGAPAVTDLVAGTLDLMVCNLPECIAQYQAGRLRPLAVTAERRHRLLPDVPTVRELGAPGLEITNWTAMMTNAAVPAAIRARLERDTLAALRDPEVLRKAEEGGFDVLAWDSARSQAFLRSEVERWRALIAEAGIRPG